MEGWLAAHPVVVDQSLQHELALCEGLLGRGDAANGAAVKVKETVAVMAKALRRAGFRFPLDSQETVAFGLIVAGSLVQHDLLMQGFFSRAHPLCGALPRPSDPMTCGQLIRASPSVFV